MRSPDLSFFPSVSTCWAVLVCHPLLNVPRFRCSTLLQLWSYASGLWDRSTWIICTYPSMVASSGWSRQPGGSLVFWNVGSCQTCFLVSVSIYVFMPRNGWHEMRTDPPALFSYFVGVESEWKQILACCIMCITFRSGNEDETFCTSV